MALPRGGWWAWPASLAVVVAVVVVAGVLGRSPPSPPPKLIFEASVENAPGRWSVNLTVPESSTGDILELEVWVNPECGQAGFGPEILCPFWLNNSVGGCCGWASIIESSSANPPYSFFGELVPGSYSFTVLDEIGPPGAPLPFNMTAALLDTGPP